MDTRTICELIRSAYAAQKSCNLHQVLTDFATDVARLRVILGTSIVTAGDRDVSDTVVNRHPMCVLYSAHICKITGSEVGLRLSRAYEWCEHMLQQEVLPHSPIPIPEDAN